MFPCGICVLFPGWLEGPRSLIRAHRYVLVSRSAVFELMFYSRNRSTLQTSAAGALSAGPAAGAAPAAGTSGAGVAAGTADTSGAGVAAGAADAAAAANGSSHLGSGEMPEGELVISITDTDPGIFRQLLK